MKYYKTLDRVYIKSIGFTPDDIVPRIIRIVEISEEEYNIIKEKFENKPKPTDTIDYRLRNDTLEWEEYEKPSEEATLEDMYIILNRLGVTE